MLAELAIANAAFAVVKEFVGNGRDIWEAGDSLVQYFSAKNEIQHKAHKNGYKSDLEAFMAAEQLKQQEEELKQLMIYSGRAGMWNDWLEFQSNQKQKREQKAKIAAERKKNRKKKIIDGLIIGGAVVTCLSIIIVFFYILSIA